MAPARPNPAELDLARALARRPQLVARLGPDVLEHLTPGSAPYKITAAILDLHDRRIQITHQAIAERSGIEYEQIQQYDLEATMPVLNGFEGTLDMVAKYGLKRRGLLILQQAFTMLTQASTLDVEETFQRILEEIAQTYRPNASSGPIALGEIITTYLNRPPELSLWRIPTGFTWIDNLTEGGITENDLWVIFGPFKQGKTQVARVILYNMATMGYHVVHFAHDGGNRYRHGMYYLSMAIQEEMIAQGVGEMGLRRTDQGVWEKVLLTPGRVESFLRGHKLDINVHGNVREIIVAKAAELQRDGPVSGNLRIYDASDLRHDPRRVVGIMEREYVQNGMQVWMFDHGGELGEASDPIFTRTETAAQMLDSFTKEHKVAGIVLSQVTRDSMGKEENYNPSHRGGDAWIIKCAMNLRVGRTNPDDQKSAIKLTVAHSRFTEQGKDVSGTFRPYLHAGYVLEETGYETH